MDHHSCRLVDDGEVLVFMEDVEGDILGYGVEGRRVGGTFNFDRFAAVELLLGFGRVAIDTDLAGFDEHLDTGAADVREGLGEVLVEAEITGGGICKEGADAVFGLLFSFEDRYGERGGFIGAAAGDVFRSDGAPTVAFGQHVLRGHGRPASGVAGR